MIEKDDFEEAKSQIDNYLSTEDKINKLWPDELKHFEECYDIEVDENKLEELYLSLTDIHKTHIFYHLLVAKLFLEQ